MAIGLFLTVAAQGILLPTPMIDRITPSNGYTTGYVSATSTIHYVSLSGAHVAPFTNWHTAATNIQAAIDAAEASDLVSSPTAFMRRAGAPQAMGPAA